MMDETSLSLSLSSIVFKLGLRGRTICKNRVDNGNTYSPSEQPMNETKYYRITITQNHSSNGYELVSNTVDMAS